MIRAPATLSALALSAALAAGCGGGSGSSSTGTGTAQTTATATSEAAPTAAIRRNWAAFFDGRTPVSRRVALLQDGQRFARAIKAQSSTPVANRTGAKVSSVKLTDPSHAAVVYTISVAGHAVLKDRHGTAVLQSGTWKVGDQSFCRLLGLQGTPVPGCQSGG
jgi:hypothetical protein